MKDFSRKLQQVCWQMSVKRSDMSWAGGAVFVLEELQAHRGGPGGQMDLSVWGRPPSPPLSWKHQRKAPFYLIWWHSRILFALMISWLLHKDGLIKHEWCQWQRFCCFSGEYFSFHSNKRLLLSSLTWCSSVRPTENQRQRASVLRQRSKVRHRHMLHRNSLVSVWRGYRRRCCSHWARWKRIPDKISDAEAGNSDFQVQLKGNVALVTVFLHRLMSHENTRSASTHTSVAIDYWSVDVSQIHLSSAPKPGPLKTLCCAFPRQQMWLCFQT